MTTRLAVRAGGYLCPHTETIRRAGGYCFTCGAWVKAPAKPNPYAQVDATPGRSAAADAVHNAVKAMRRQP